jgi:hypothetical protein
MSVSRMWCFVAARCGLICCRNRRSISNEKVYEFLKKHNIAEPAADGYLRALVDVWRLLESAVLAGQDEQALLSDLYGKMTEQRTAADQFYWQVFPVITTAEAFIFYISVGSGSLAEFPDGRKLVAAVGLGFVVICWYSFYVNKSKLDIYTLRLFWLEVLTGRPQLHAASLMQTSERRFFSTTLYNAWQTFFVFLIACHVVSILWMCRVHSIGSPVPPWLRWCFQSEVQWWVLAVVPVYALAPDLFNMFGNKRRW